MGSRSANPAPAGSPAGPGPDTALTAAPPQARSEQQPASAEVGVMRSLPFFCRGEVVRGFGRGSKQLGIPTGERLVRPGSSGSWGRGPGSRVAALLLLPPSRGARSGRVLQDGLAELSSCSKFYSSDIVIIDSGGSSMRANVYLV